MQNALRQASRGPSADFVLEMDNLDFIKNPYPAFRYLREHAPVYDWRERAALVFSRYDDVREVLAERDLSIDMNCWEHAPSKDHAPELADYYRVQKNGLIELPPLDHQRIRKLAGGAFLPRNVGGMSTMVQNVIDRTLSDYQGDVEINFRPLADLIPMQVISALLKIPAEMEDEFRALGLAISVTTDLRLTGAQRVSLLSRWSVWMQMLTDVINHRRQKPLADDFLSYLISVRDQEQRLSEDELVSMIVELITAGADTTVHASCLVIYNLLRHPEQFALLQQNPTLLRSAIEETMRFDHIIKHSLPRFALRDMVVANVALHKGQAVYPLLPSALRDEQVFPLPDKLDIQRDLGRNIVYSVGPHNCLGAGLARLNLDLFIGTMLQRFPKLRLTGEAEFAVHPILRPIAKLPIFLATV